MTNYVLSVWPAGAQPADGGAPLRLVEEGGAAPLATHADGFDTSPFLHDGAPVDPDFHLSATGLMDTDGKRAVGEALWARLTPGAIGPALEPLLGHGRVYLDLRADELRRYPWELLRHDNATLFAMPNLRWCLGRPDPRNHFAGGTPPPADHPLRVLVVLGNRPTETNIRARDELMTIERLAHRHNVDVLLTTLLQPSAADIQEALLRFRPHVFHFIGHGGDDGDEPAQIFVYSREAQFSDPWSADRVRSVFAQAPPRVVVLNACLTAHAPTQATSLVEAFVEAGCIAVIAMLGKILGTASEAFSERFYRELFAGTPVDTATALARLSVGQIAGTDAFAVQLRSNWALPRLTVRGDADAAVTLPHLARPVSLTWLEADFVTRWDERWRAGRTMDGSLKGEGGRESRLVVLTGPQDAGKRELLNTLADVRRRAGDAVVYVDLSKGPTGRWPDVLERIAEQAAEVGFDATALLEVARSGGTGTQVIPQFRAQLESLQRPGAAAPDEPVLVVIDGLSDWVADEVRQTVLPLLCWPLLQYAPESRLRMMISLRDELVDGAWAARPADWQPIAVGNFAAEEWERAIEHLRDHWLSQIEQRRPGLIDGFKHSVEATRLFPFAERLGSLRSLAKVILR